jgi:hypothetical protein
LKLKLQILFYKLGSQESKPIPDCDIQKECQNGSKSVKYSVLQVNIKLLTNASDLSGTDLDMTGIEVEDHELEEEENCIMVIASNILQHRELLQTAAHSLADGGCILAREMVDTNSVLNSGFRLNVVFEKTLKDEKLLLLRKVTVTINRFFRNRLHLRLPLTYLSVWPCSYSIKAAELERSYKRYFKRNIEKCLNLV